MSRIMLVGSIAIFFKLTVPGLAADPNEPPCAREDIEKLVCVTTKYDPDYKPYDPPADCNSTDGYKSQVGDAYDSAPWKVKQELCRLKRIIIQTDQYAYSWGYWENPATKSSYGTRPNSYVGIRSDKTNSKLKNVLDYNFTRVFVNTTPIGLVPNHTVSNDYLRLGLLAVLAHEIGHIKWHRDNIYSSLNCYYEEFVGQNKSWKDDNFLAYSVIRTWHPSFDDANAGGPANSRASHANAAAPDPHASSLTPGEVRNLYTNGFVSAAAGISPEEDFVETYTLLTVLNIRGLTPPTISLKISNGMPVDVPDNSSQSKRDCIGPALINFPN
jgi:hypothetical protein